MKITVGTANMIMYPENQAEVLQLEWLNDQLNLLNKTHFAPLQWNITSLGIPLKDKTQEKDLLRGQVKRLDEICSP